MAVSPTTSSDGGIIIYTGTFQEVLDALEDAGYNDMSKIRFWYNGTAGSCSAAVFVRSNAA